MKFKIDKSGTKTIRIVNDQGEFMGGMSLELDKGNYELIMILNNSDEYANSLKDKK